MKGTIVCFLWQWQPLLQVIVGGLKQKLSKQLEQEQNHRNGHHMEGFQWGGREGRMGGKVQGLRSIIGRSKTDRGKLRILWGPWLVWLSGLSAGLWTKRSPVRFPLKAHVWVAGQVPSRGHARGNITLMFLSLSFSLLSLLSKNNFFLSLKKCFKKY